MPNLLSPPTQNIACHPVNATSSPQHKINPNTIQPYSTNSYHPRIRNALSSTFSLFHQTHSRSTIQNYPPSSTIQHRDWFFGHLKFYLESKRYGFLVLDETGDEIFFHFDDLNTDGVTPELLALGSNRAYLPNTALKVEKQFNLRFCFCILEYLGKYGPSKKATNVRLMEITAAEKSQFQDIKPTLTASEFRSSQMQSK